MVEWLPRSVELFTQRVAEFLRAAGLRQTPGRLLTESVVWVRAKLRSKFRQSARNPVDMLK